MSKTIHETGLLVGGSRDGEHVRVESGIPHIDIPVPRGNSLIKCSFDMPIEKPTFKLERYDATCICLGNPGVYIRFFRHESLSDEKAFLKLIGGYKQGKP